MVEWPSHKIRASQASVWKEPRSVSRAGLTKDTIKEKESRSTDGAGRGGSPLRVKPES